MKTANLPFGEFAVFFVKFTTNKLKTCTTTN